MPGPGPGAVAVAQGGASHVLAGRFLALEYPWGALTSWFPKLLQWQEPEGVGKSGRYISALSSGSLEEMQLLCQKLLGLGGFASLSLFSCRPETEWPGKELKFCTSSFCAIMSRR